MDARKLDEMIAGFAGAMTAGLGSDLSALYLFGSIMIAEDFHRGISDIDTFVVFADDADDGAIIRTSAVYRSYRAHSFAIPLMMKAGEVRAAADVFPVELVEMQEQNRLLAGTDILRKLSFSIDDIRRQCETEVRAKIIGLRKMLFAEKELVKHQEVLYKSLTSTIVLLKQALRIRGVPLPKTRAGIIEALSREFGRSFDGVASLHRMRASEERITKNVIERLVGDYLENLEYFSGIFNETR